jgi:hypothetical protein
MTLSRCHASRALDANGEICCSPNPKVRMRANWTMGRQKLSSVPMVAE